MKKITALIVALFFISIASAHGNDTKSSKQLLIVTTLKPGSVNGILQRFQRYQIGGSWLQVGSPIKIVVGKKGVSTHKHEGDMKTPEGIFFIVSAFGISKRGSKLTALPYRLITPSTVCVDDQDSLYYNQIIDASKIAPTSWHSGEKMYSYKTPYQLGLLSSFNHLNKPGDGSCVFIHVWRGFGHGTSGCVAMARANMVKLFKWLQPKDHPVILIGHYILE